jgi:glycosyltransferase involved in cell wall biosynthesis
MPEPRVLFVNHTGKIAGAELVLLDVVRRWRGASAFVFEQGPLAAALSQRGLHVVTSRFGRGLNEVRRDSSLWKSARLFGRLGAIVVELIRAARRHDVVYANSQKAFTLAALACTLARRPLVWHLHDIIDASHFGAAQRRLQVALANRCASRVIVPSAPAAAAFIAAGGRADLVEVVPNGIDLTRDHRSRAELRQDLGLPDGPLVGVFSRLAPWKGQHVVLRALAAIPGVHCVVAGDALFGEQAYAARLRRMVSELGLGGRVHFLGHRDDVPRLMQAVDIMIHPSVDAEPFGRTLVEAMLSGVPVVATDTGAAADILAGGAAGTLIPPDDPDALAAAVTRLLADPAGRAAQVAQAATRARSHYAVGTMLQSISSLIDQAACGAHT